MVSAGGGFSASPETGRTDPEYSGLHLFTSVIRVLVKRQVLDEAALWDP
jgi:hypothetical protein